MKVWWVLVKDESYRLSHNLVLTPMLLVASLMYVSLFGGVYWNALCLNTPIMVIDQDHSYMSRNLILAFQANEYFHIAFYGESPEEISLAMRRNLVYGAVVIPRKFESDMLAGRESKVEVIVDGSNILTGNVISRMAHATVTTFQTSVRAQRFMAAGIPRPLAAASATPIQMVNRQLFNPSGNYTVFILIGIAGIAIQQLTRIAAAISLSLDVGLEGRRSIDGQPCSALVYLLAKLFGAALVGLPTSCIALSLPFVAFKTPFHAHWLALYALLTVFVLLQILIGYGLAGLCHDVVLVTQFLIFVSVPSFTLSGFTWPWYAMPRPLQWVSWLVPLSHLNDMVRRMALAGTSIWTLMPQVGAMLLWIPPAFFWAWWAIRKETDLS